MSEPAADSPADAALQAALARLLAPLARLVVARGLPFAVIDEMLRQAVVTEAHAAHPGLPEHRRASRVSASTGLNRREVNRLLAARQDADAAAAPPRSPAAAVFAHWRASPDYRAPDGNPLVLPRIGARPSFEALAQEVTRDVHPRALLEELLRLDLAAHDGAEDTVRLTRQAFVPHGDTGRMTQWMGANVGDHLDAAVSNLLGSDPAHFEQAIAAGNLSAESVAEVRPLLQAHWQRLTDELVPLLETLIERDAGRGTPAPHRMRLGLYGFDDAPRGAAPSSPAKARLAGPRRTKT